MRAKVCAKDYVDSLTDMPQVFNEGVVSLVISKFEKWRKFSSLVSMLVTMKLTTLFILTCIFMYSINAKKVSFPKFASQMKLTRRQATFKLVRYRFFFFLEVSTVKLEQKYRHGIL